MLKSAPHLNAHLPAILHIDERLIACDKPTGLLSVPGIGPEKQDCLATRVQASYPEARIVHRLDRDTSGVIIMARDAEAHRELSRQFHDREVEKKYIAVVHGLVQRDGGEVDAPIRKNMDTADGLPLQMIDPVHGRPSRTQYRVLGRDHEANRTRLELTPVTGRSHQLRLHLQSIGHPILGDGLYAPPEVLAMSERLMLHAQSLFIVHPSTAAPLTIESPCPF